MIYSGANIIAQSFCPKPSPSVNMVIMTTPENERVSLDFTIIGDTNIEQTIKNRTAKQSDATICGTDSSRLFSVQNGDIFAIDPLDQKFTHSVNINNGLSIAGLARARFIASTQANFGGVFSGGVVAMVDANDQRLVLLSFDYVTRKLSNPTEVPAPQ